MSEKEIQNQIDIAEAILKLDTEQHQMNLGNDVLVPLCKTLLELVGKTK